MLSSIRGALLSFILIVAGGSASPDAHAGTRWIVATADDRCEAAATYFKEMARGVPLPETPADVAEQWRRAGFLASLEFYSPARALVRVTKGKRDTQPADWPLFKTVADCKGFIAFLKAENARQPQQTEQASVTSSSAPAAPSAEDWFVITEARRCEAVSSYFQPMADRNLVPETPADVAELWRGKGRAVTVQFRSPTLVLVEAKHKQRVESGAWSFYTSAGQCEKHLAALDEVKGQIGERAARQPPPSLGYGMYGGKSSGIEVGLETKTTGTALVIVNHGTSDFSVAPRDLMVRTALGSSSPCTFHLMSLGGMGVPSLALTVRPGKKEGLMLGACPSTANDGALTSRFVISAPVTSVQLGKLTVPVKPN